MENKNVFKGQNNKVLTSSVLVAETFVKEHKRVLQDIRELKCSAEFRQHHFVPSSYTSIQNKELPMYVMDKDGFVLLVMGYTGELAMKFKEKYISEFNQMKKELKDNSPKKIKSSAELFAMQVQINLEYEHRIANVEEKLAEIEADRIIKTEMLLSAPVSAESTPQISLRDNIRQLVNKYSAATGIKQQDVWHKVYNQLYYLYHINLKAYKKEKKNETYLEVAERNLLLDKIYIIISNLVREL